MPQGGHQVNAQIWRHDETRLLIEQVNQLGKQWKAIGQLLDVLRLRLEADGNAWQKKKVVD